MRAAALLLLLAGLVGPVAPALAQDLAGGDGEREPRPERAHDRAILAAVAERLRVGVPHPVALDPRITAYDARPGHAWIGSWPFGLIETMSRRIPAEVVELEEATRCFGTRGIALPAARSCDLVGYRTHLSVSLPVVEGGSASVIVRLAGDPVPMRARSRTIRLRLEQTTDGWRMAGTRTLSVD